jgi:phosphatidylinositol glycan class H protein
MGSYMGQQEHGISDGLYTYKHHREGGADIHVIFVKKSKFMVLLSYIGTMFLLATVCCALLSKVFFLK